MRARLGRSPTVQAWSLPMNALRALVDGLAPVARLPRPKSALKGISAGLALPLQIRLTELLWLASTTNVQQGTSAQRVLQDQSSALMGSLLM